MNIDAEYPTGTDQSLSNMYLWVLLKKQEENNGTCLPILVVLSRFMCPIRTFTRAGKIVPASALVHNCPGVILLILGAVFIEFLRYITLVAPKLLGYYGQVFTYPTLFWGES